MSAVIELFQVSDEEKLLNGSQAAEFLGVKPATLYAYASRGLIESYPAQSGRERCYRLTELIKLRQSSRGFKAPRDSEPAVWTGPVIKSSITEIRPDGHRYRGENALELAAADRPFESVVEILWETEGVLKTPWRKVKPLPLSRPVKSLAGRDSDYLDLLKLLLVSVEIDDTVTRRLNSDDLFEAARRLIATMSVTPGIARHRDKYIPDNQLPIAHTLLHALSGNKSRERARVINRALVLCADHELNASALAARVAASCDASLYSCLLSALGSFSGTLHGSASRRTEDLVSNSFKFRTAKAWMQDYLRQFDTIPGFGTELYEKGDPRSKLLLSTAKEVAGRNKNLIRLTEIIDCVREELNLEPNLDVGLTAVSYALALPPGAATAVFAVSRTAGWIAHAVEQRLYGGVIRPRARYIGRT